MLPGLIHSQKWQEARIETIFRYMQYIVTFVAFFVKFSACCFILFHMLFHKMGKRIENLDRGFLPTRLQ